MTTRVRWRGLELPTRVVTDPKFKSDTYGRFMVEPFERGFGTTVGNSLRRVLLSSLEGAAVSSIKIKGVTHEFSPLKGVMEDVTDIVLNIKNLVVKLEGEESKTMKLAARGPGEVTADMIQADTAVTILNKDLVLATLTDAVDFEMELVVTKGRGYVPASEQYNTGEEQEIGRIHVDAIYSPVQRVRYKIEDTRVGQRTNYDKLTMEIWTNGTVPPEMALVEAAKIFRKHLNPFIQYAEPGPEIAIDEFPQPTAQIDTVDAELERKLNMSLAELELSVRATNCLESEGITTVRDLVIRTDEELLEVRNFGETTLKEVKSKLQERGLHLGMKLPSSLRR